MNWKEKMASVVCQVINDGRNEYSLHFENDLEFYLLKNGQQILRTKALNIESHWKKLARQTIDHVIEGRYKKILNENENIS